MSLLTELQRRNVFRVAAAYAVIAWLIAQIADVALDAFGTPDWVPKTVLFLLVVGFPLVVVFAWAYELTPEGVKREKDVDRAESITRKTGRKLDRIIIAVLVFAVGFLLVDKFVLRDTAPPPATVAGSSADAVDRSVAVLPFVAMSNGPDDEYFADGLTEEILNSLAQLPELLVTARTSAFAFKGQDVPIPEIALKLGVANVVEGSVRRAGERLRVTAQLIRAQDGFHLWSETYERPAADSFGVQDEIAEKVATALDIVLDRDQLATMRSSGLRDPEAFVSWQKAAELYTRAHELDDADLAEGLRQANVYFERTLELAPDFSPAHFDHSDYYIHHVLAGSQTGELSDAEIAADLGTAESDLQDAIRTAASEGERLNATLEHALLMGQFRRLPQLYAAAAETSECLDPSWWSTISRVLPSLDGPLALWSRERQCDPLNFYTWTNLARVYSADGRFDKTIEVAQEGLATVPHRYLAQELVWAYIGTGRFDEAAAASQRLIESEVGRQSSRFLIAAARGEADTARALHNELIQTPAGESDLGIVAYAVLGDRDVANQMAAEIDAAPLGHMALLGVVADCKCGMPFDLEATPRFAEMVREADLLWPPRSPIDWPLKDW